MAESEWVDVGPVEELSKAPVRPVLARTTKLAITCEAGQFGAISGVCNHAGGPLGEGKVDGGYVTCPWHHYKFHARTGLGEPGYEQDKVPSYTVKVEGGRVFVDLKSATPRGHLPHPAHPVGRPVSREAGPVRVVGISTTVMDAKYPRYSTSEALLDAALSHAKDALACEARLIRVNDLHFRACEGYYSKSARACTWPCSITQMDKKDEMAVVYEAVVHWADVILVSTPIRWGAASSLYYKMVERMNCIQNQATVADRVLLKNKVAAFVITGGQDNVQAVAGQMLGFFAEVGCQFPQFPYVAHSRGWSAEDMENNVRYVRESETLREGARGLVARAVDLARLLVGGAMGQAAFVGGGRKANRLDARAQT